MTLQRRQFNQRGFSLLELIVVLAIVGLLFGMVGTSIYRSLDSVKIRQTSKDLMTALRYTRAQAVASREEQFLTVDIENRRYQAPERDWEDFPEDVEISLKTAADDLDLTSGKVRFYPDGSSTGALISLQIESRSWTVRVGWLTGELSVEQSG